MATGSEETRVPISIPVDDSAAGKAAQSIDQLREAVQKSKDALKDYAAQMRDIRGNSDEMKAARDELRKKLEAEKVAISDGALALAKQGVSYDRLATAAKRTAKEQEKAAKDAAKEAKASEKEQEKAAKDAMKEKSDALKSAIGSAGGPVSAISSKLNGLTDVLGGTSGGMAAVAGAAALVAAGLYAVGKAAVSAAYDIGKWIVVAADAERLSQLTRQANLGGNETSAKNLGDQVDAIARKVPLARDQIEKFGIALNKARIGGQANVDLMKAMAGASAATGNDDAANKLGEIAKRSALTKRVQVNPLELIGTGLDFDDLARSLAKRTGQSLEAARRALFEGRVKLTDYAAASADAIEKKFDKINQLKLIGIDNQVTKLKGDLASMTKDVDLEPLLKFVKKLLDNFDSATVNGKALKGVVTTIGNSISAAFGGGSGDSVQDWVDQVVLGIVKLEGKWLDAQLAWKSFTDGLDQKGVDRMAMVKVTTFALGAAMDGLVIGLDAGVKLFFALAEAGAKVQSALQGASDSLAAFKKEAFGDGQKSGSSIVDGIVEGVAKRSGALGDSIRGLATLVKGTFTSDMQIHSPSKVSEQWGRYIDQGVERGVDADAGRVQAAVSDMVPSGSGGGAAAGAAGARIVHLTFAPQLSFNGRPGDASELRDPAVLELLYEGLLARLAAAGIEAA